MASHVIEHVPDMIGWLWTCRGLKEDGIICLAIPDRRFTFDLLRPESTIGEMVEAYLSGRAAAAGPPSFRQGGVARGVPQGPGVGRRHGRPIAAAGGAAPDAYSLAERVASSVEYVDTHCWVFTPESFLDVAERLSRIGLFPFAIEYFHPTEYGDYEFYTRLRKSEDAATIAASFLRRGETS